VRVLVLGVGVIGSVYAARLIDAGHDVTLLARGQRLTDLRTGGLLLEEASSGTRGCYRPTVVESPDIGGPFDLVLVAVRRDQLDRTVPLLDAAPDADVLFFGNTAGRVAELTSALGQRALFGFPAAGGVREGSVVRYVTIRQQRTMLAEPAGDRSPRVRALAETFAQAGFASHVIADPEAWLVAHAAFVVPIAFALYRVGVDPARLAGERPTLRLMVRATRQAFQALRSDGNSEIPSNLVTLYLRLPEPVAVAYWRHVLAGPNGELWFAAHTRAAPEEMHALAEALLAQMNSTTTPAPALAELLTT